MKSKTNTQHFAFYAVVKFLGRAFKSMFESQNNREFRRLKNFIAS